MELESIEKNGFIRRRPGEYEHLKNPKKLGRKITVFLHILYFQFLSRLTLMFDKARTKGHVQLLMKRRMLTIVIILKEYFYMFLHF